MESIKLRKYQKEAIENFKNNNYSGIFEMATGTGKTFTSLVASQDYYIKKKKLFLIILVPFNHLITQWIENINIFYKKNILVCNNSKKSWIYNLESKVRDYNGKISDLEIVITTYKTASSEEFNYLISKIKKDSFIIADECHYFGMKSLENHKLSNITCKLGLSATPDRWWDEKGSSFIRDYFNNTIFSYDMKMAIDNQNLTEYTYDFFTCIITN